MLAKRNTLSQNVFHVVTKAIHDTNTTISWFSSPLDTDTVGKKRSTTTS